MKAQRIFLSLIIAFSLILGNVSTVSAMPPIPSSFYGVVTVDGVDAPAGSTVSAWINGVMYAQTTVGDFGGDTVYSLDVPGDDAETAGEVEGGTDGETIVFHVNDLVADQTGTWTSGTNVALNLTALNTYTLNYTAGTGGSIAGDNPQTVNHGEDGTEVIAVPDTGYHFVDWSDNVLTAARTDTNVTADLSVTANFALDTHDLTIATAGNGSGTVTPVVGVHSYNYGTVVALEATADTGSTFDGWSGDDDCESASVTMDADKACTATFTLDIYDLTIATAGNGSGTVTPVVGVHSYNYGTVVALEATAAIGSTFDGWSGDDDCESASVTMDVDKSCTATFTLNTYTLNYTAGTGGSITGDNPQTVNYGEDGTEVVAVPDIGYHFEDWSDGVTTAARTDTSITADLSVTANFARTVFTHGISLEEGWNLVSFNLQPVDTDLAAVLLSIAGNYDLVYAWDATGAHAGSGNWMKHDDLPQTTDTLTTLDETMGFWIHMLSADTLDVMGYQPTTTDIVLTDDVGGWNLVAYPSSSNAPLPEVLSDHGVGTDFSLVYAYHAADAVDPWKLFDLVAPPFASDLTEMSPGWGYWVKVSADNTWNVEYVAP